MMRKREMCLWGVLVVLLWNPATCRAQTAAVQLNKGQVLSLVTSITKSGKAAARERYFQQLQPLATPYGFKLEGSLRIKATHAADYRPSPPVMNIFSWPSRDAHLRFTQDARWPGLRAKRKSIWKELRIVNVPVKENTTLRFRAGKLYRVAFLWINNDHPDDFQRYRDAMKTTAIELGAQYLLETTGETYESLQEPRRQPDRMWIVEWPDRQAHRTYLQSDTFQSNVRFFRSGVEKFDVFEAAFAVPGRR